MEAVHVMKKAKLFPVELEREVQLERDAQELKLQNELEQHDKDAASFLEDLPPLAKSGAREKHDLAIQKKQIVLTGRREELEALRAAKVLELREARELKLANESTKMCPRCHCAGIPGDVLKCPSCSNLFDPPPRAVKTNPTKSQPPVMQTRAVVPVSVPVHVAHVEVKTENIDNSLTQEIHATQLVHAIDQSGQTEDELARAVNQEADFERIEPVPDHEQSVSAGQFSNNELSS